MSIDVNDATVEQEAPAGLSELLSRLTVLFDQKDKISSELAAVNKEIDRLEPLAVEAMAAAGLDGVKACGKSWYFRDVVSVSVPSDNRAAVVEAAKAAGLADFVTVNTSTLKSWLVERWRDAGKPETVTGGTPFEGLVQEYREIKLGRQTRG